MLGAVRRMLPTWLLAAVCLAGVACGGSRPDVVLVTLDTLRRDHVGAYGWKLPGPSPTPRIDAFAKGARVFEGALTTMPTTSPAHASIFTGLRPREHGVLRNGDRVPEALAAERGLPRKLRDAGYRAAAFVTSDVFGPGAIGLGGFDPYDVRPKGLRPGSDAVAAALAWLDRVSRGEKKPVFLWVHLYDPHSPYGAAAAKAGHYPVDLKSYGWVERARYRDKKVRIAMATKYADGVRDADRAFGELLDGLAERGREPLVLVAADHGEFMAEYLDRLGFAYGHGSLLGPEVLWVPLLVAGPGIDPARVAGAASIADLYTTVLEATGLGDPRAAEEGRIDLRGDPPPGRLVEAARRFFNNTEKSQRLDKAALRHIRSRAVAVSDGAALLVVGVDGKPSDGKAPAPALVAAARTALAAQRAGEEGRREAPLDAETKRKLEALGYVER
jgi:arylsulfatase A-like enzyme